MGRVNDPIAIRIQKYNASFHSGISSIGKVNVAPRQTFLPFEKISEGASIATEKKKIRKFRMQIMGQKCCLNNSLVNRLTNNYRFGESNNQNRIRHQNGERGIRFEN